MATSIVGAYPLFDPSTRELSTWTSEFGQATLWCGSRKHMTATWFITLTLAKLRRLLDSTPHHRNRHQILQAPATAYHHSQIQDCLFCKYASRL